MPEPGDNTFLRGSAIPSMGILWSVSMKWVGRRTLRVGRGFSLVEVVMTLAIGLILVSVALPMLVNALQAYRLNSFAQQTSNLLDLARYTAIRRNALLSLRTTTQRGATVVYIDANGNGRLDGNESMLIVPSDMEFVSGQTLPVGGVTQDFVNQIVFDYRGTVNFQGGGPVATYVLAIDYTNQKQYGTRAVTVSPMGHTKLWTLLGSGTWSQM